MALFVELRLWIGNAEPDKATEERWIDVAAIFRCEFAGEGEIHG